MRLLVLCVLFATACTRTPSEAPSAAAAVCEHGVKSAICARCNPKLRPAFESKGDWCPEHARPESQCVICNPRLAKDGIK